MEEVQNNQVEDVLWPPRIDITQVGLFSIWSIVSWFVWSVVIILSIFLFWQNVQEFKWVYPYIYCITSFFAILFTAWLNIFFGKIINPEKYKRWSLTFMQVFLLLISIVIFTLPIYIYSVSVKYDYLIYVFVTHVIIALLGTSIFTEVLSNYRYILLGLFGSFIGTIISIFLTAIVIFTFQESSKNLYILMWMLILINFTIVTFKSLFEFLYYIYYSKTWMDQLGDIFYQIELEEKELVEKARQELEKF